MPHSPRSATLSITATIEELELKYERDHEWTDEEDIIDEAELGDFDRALLESLGPDVTIRRNADGCLIYSLGPPEEGDLENGAN